MQKLVGFGPRIWTADGPIVRTMGIPFPTRMIVVKLHDGSLWVNSPVQGSREELNSLSSMDSRQTCARITLTVMLNAGLDAEKLGDFVTALLWL